MSNKYRNTPHKTTKMKFETLETTPEVREIEEIEYATVSVPAQGDSHIRFIEFADGRKEWHVEVFLDGAWGLYRKYENFKEAQNIVDWKRNNHIITNKILDY